MHELYMPVLARLLVCAALVTALGAASPVSDRWPQPNANAQAIPHLPTTSSFSGYIIAVG